MDKRGISDVVTTVLIILVSIIAVIVVWQFIRGAINQGADRLNNPIFTDFQIDKAELVDGINAKITVSLGAETKKIYGVAIVLSNGVESQIVYYNQTMNNLEARTFTIPLNISGINKVSVSPGFYNKNNNLEYSGVTDSETSISSKNENLAAYYRLEGDASDSSGNGNNGLLINGVDCSVAGKIGNACSFDGVNDYINISRIFSAPLSYSAWIYQTSGDGGTLIDSRVQFKIVSNGNLMVQWNDGTWHTFTSSSIITYNSWNFVVLAYNGTTARFYINGNADPSAASFSNYGGYVPTQTRIGSDGFSDIYTGKIDDVRIYNRSLSDQEVKFLARA